MLCKVYYYHKSPSSPAICLPVRQILKNIHRVQTPASFLLSRWMCFDLANHRRYNCYYCSYVVATYYCTLFSQDSRVTLISENLLRFCRLNTVTWGWNAHDRVSLMINLLIGGVNRVSGAQTGRFVQSETLSFVKMHSGKQSCGWRMPSSIPCLLTFPPPATCLILSLEPQRDCTLLKSNFLSRICTWKVDMRGQKTVILEEATAAELQMRTVSVVVGGWEGVSANRVT